MPSKSSLESWSWVSKITSPVACEFSEGEICLEISKNPETSEKEKWSNPFSVAFKLEACSREIAGKIQNTSEIANHTNHKARVYVINWKVFTILFEIIYLFLTFIHFITFKMLQKMIVWKWKKETRQTFMQVVFLRLPIKRTETILKLDDQSHTRRKKNQSTEVLWKRLLFKI